MNELTINKATLNFLEKVWCSLIRYKLGPRRNHNIVSPDWVAFLVSITEGHEINIAQYIVEEILE